MSILITFIRTSVINDISFFSSGLLYVYTVHMYVCVYDVMICQKYVKMQIVEVASLLLSDPEFEDGAIVLVYVCISLSIQSSKCLMNHKTNFNETFRKQLLVDHLQLINPLNKPNSIGLPQVINLSKHKNGINLVHFYIH